VWRGHILPSAVASADSDEWAAEVYKFARARVPAVLGKPLLKDTRPTAPARSMALACNRPTNESSMPVVTRLGFA